MWGVGPVAHRWAGSGWLQGGGSGLVLRVFLRMELSVEVEAGREGAWGQGEVPEGGRGAGRSGRRGGRRREGRGGGGDPDRMGDCQPGVPVEHRGRQVRTQGWAPSGGPTCVSVQTWSHAKLEKLRSQATLNAQSEGRGQSTARRVPAPRREDRRSGEELAAAGRVWGRRGGRGRGFRECSWPAQSTGAGTDPVQGGERGPAAGPRDWPMGRRESTGAGRFPPSAGGRRN